MSICKYISNDGLCLLHSETFYKEPCIEGPCHDYTAMTNAEHIRTMTDVKMAELFADVGACFYDDADVCEKWNGACDKCWLDWLKQEIDCGADMRGKEKKMSEIVREMTREELVACNNELREENEKLKEELKEARFAVEHNNNLVQELREENEKRKEELKEARFAVEHNNNLVQEERLRHELYRKDGEISGLRFALRCITEGCHGKAVLDEVEG